MSAKSYDIITEIAKKLKISRLKVLDRIIQNYPVDDSKQKEAVADKIRDILIYKKSLQ